MRRKSFLTVISALLAVIFSLSLIACSGNNSDGGASGGDGGGSNVGDGGNNGAQTQEWDISNAYGFELPHASAAEQDDKYYNSELFYRNESQITGADPGCIYVSESQIKQAYQMRKKDCMYRTESGDYDWIDGWDEQRFTAEYGTESQWVEDYANCYYMAVTGSISSTTQAVRDKYGFTAGGYSFFRSTDLVDWENCGFVDGYAIGYDASTAWMYDSFWAPELFFDEDTGLYFMFFGAKTKTGNADHTYPPYTKNGHGNTRGSVCYAETPIGPYVLLTAEIYIEYLAAKNKAGEIMTGDKLIPDNISMTSYYEVYGYDGEVIGYKNGDVYYNLNGYVIDLDTPIVNPTYYFPIYSKDQAKVAEFYELSTKQVVNGDTFYYGETLDLYPMVVDGQKYLYFTSDLGVFSGIGYGIWAVEMKDWLSPDWNTLTYITKPSYTVVNQNGKLLGSEEGLMDMNEKGVNEGTAIVPHNGKFYLTYSNCVFSDTEYYLGIAVADHPLGPFVKQEKYSPLLGKGSEENDYMGGTGHHTFVNIGEELFILYHAHLNPENPWDNNDNFMGRFIAIDKAIWKYEPELGYDMMYCNGATSNLQPKPEEYTGYTNVAKYATITGNGDIGTADLLCDGMFTAQPFSRKYEYGKTDGDLRIKLSFDRPVEIVALMVYNSGGYYTAINKVNMINFKLAEKPAWYLPEQYNGYCFIENLAMKASDCMSSRYIMRHGGAAIAEFNPIKITEMTLYISGNKEDKYTEENEEGSIFTGYKQAQISEIYLFGNEA